MSQRDLTKKIVQQFVVDLQSQISAMQTQVNDLQKEIDSIPRLSEKESARLRAAMDRMSTMTSNLSNLLHKASDSATALISNIK